MIVRLKTTMPVYVEVDTETETVTKVTYAYDEVGNLVPESGQGLGVGAWSQAVRIGHTKPWPRETKR